MTGGSAGGGGSYGSSGYVCQVRSISWQRRCVPEAHEDAREASQHATLSEGEGATGHATATVHYSKRQCAYVFRL